jgi:glucose/arabinose dehydrogenase/mono/diheme cytochrome c family protein
MTRTLPRRLSITLALALFLASFGASLFGIHPKNAGPQQFEIKFKLPPPKPLSPEEALATFKVAPGFKVELVAAEPMIEAPVAISWDDQGRMYVLEMRTYMHDVEGAGEDQSANRVVVLEDTDGDGKMDKRTIFAENLFLPRTVMCVNGGALVSEPPILWFMKDTDGDGKADLKEQVDGSYASRTGQPEHMANSATWCLDNWVYSANHGTRYRLKDGNWISEIVPSRGQWGMSQDDYGRRFYNFNSDFLRANFVPDHLYKRNPNFPAAAGAGVQILKDQTCWPSHPTPGVNRGYEKTALRPDGTLKASTATCGAAIYRGGLFPAEFAGNAFIPEPSANLVKRAIIDEKNGELTARNAYEKTEFLTSTDERFRPVTAYTGPDGALYLADMYRGVIQHKGFLTHYLVANIKDRNLEQPINQGRIWRIVPEGTTPQAAKLPTESAAILPMLGHPNGWVRDTAQRLLVERRDAAVVPALATLTEQGAPLARLHALWTLEGMGALTPEVVTKALAASDPKIRATGVRLADRPMMPQLIAMAGDDDVEVQVALAFVFSTYPEGQDALATLVRRAGGNLMVRDAAISGLRGRELEFMESLLTGDKNLPAPVLSGLAQAVMAERRATRVEKLLQVIADQSSGSPEQLALLSGAGGKPPSKDGPKVKLLYLDKRPSALTTLEQQPDAKVKPLLATLDARLAWPGKKGVPPPPVIKPLTEPEQKLFEVGKQTYTMLCAACHQPNGQGMDGLAPPLVDSEWVIGKAEILPRIILHGLSGPIKVNGTSWSLEMPPLGAALTDEQVAGVSTYIRREWEHGADPVSVEAVAKVRAKHKDRTKGWTADDMADLMSAKKPATSSPAKQAEKKTEAPAAARSEQ